MTQSKPYRVLSLDGGGIRGLYTASILQTLSNRFASSNGFEDKDIGQGFDLIAGTSSGGILACGLAAGISVRQIIDIYLNKGKEIFTNPFPFESLLKQYWWIFRNRKKAANSNKALKEALQSVFGNKTLGQIYKERQIGLCIAAVNLMDYSPKVFKTPHNAEKSADNNRRLSDVCLASSAAPIIFPAARIPDPERRGIYEDFIDGGLWANDPVLAALTEAVTCSGENQRVEIISIGTCAPPKGQTVKNPDKGLIDWRAGIGLMETSMNAQAASSRFIGDFLCSEFKQNVSICRLKQTPLSTEKAKALFMDQAREEACSILIKWEKGTLKKFMGR